jgi:hypothetical protein
VLAIEIAVQAVLAEAEYATGWVERLPNGYRFLLSLSRSLGILFRLQERELGILF